MPFQRRGLTSPADPGMLDILERMKQATKTLKQAKKRGIDVEPARHLLEESLRAFLAKDYAAASRLADEVLRQYSVSGTAGDRT